MSLATYREVPKKSGYYWFDGHVYTEGALGGTVRVRALVKVIVYDSSIDVVIAHTTYSSKDVQGTFYGPVAPPPWEVGARSSMERATVF